MAGCSPRISRWTLAWGSFVLAACGPTPAPPSFSPAQHAPFPQLLAHSGRRLSSMQLVTVSYQGYEFQTSVQSFGDLLVGSQWFSEVGSEYGIGPAKHLKKAVLPQPAPSKITDAEIVQLIDQHIADNTLPPPSAQTLYLLYFPTNSSVDATQLGIGTLCSGSGFTGYHNTTANTSNPRYAYAVVGDCTGLLADVTATSSHEIIEAATDPDLDAWYLDVPPTNPWYARNQDEVGDLCEDPAYVVEGGFSLQRIWSNAAAQAGGSPCAPIPAGEVFYDVTSDPDSVPRVGAGRTVSFTLTGWSAVPTPSWPLLAYPGPYNDFDPQQVSVAPPSLNNGGTAILTFTVPSTAAPNKLSSLMVYSGAARDRFWPVAIISQ